MENKKKQILLVIGIVTLLLAVGGATYAFFIAQNNGSDIKDVNVTTATTDTLTFNVDKIIEIKANQSNFGLEGSNRPGEAIATATLTANNATNEASGHYYLYLNIKKNEFKHVTESKSAELVLSVSKENASDGTYSPVTIASLGTQVTVGTGANEVTGYDITEVEGLIELANTDIAATKEKTKVTDKYKVTITLVNLNEDQNGNAGKSLNAELIMGKEKRYATYAEECLDKDLDTFSCSIIKQYTTDGEKGMYLHDGKGTYVNANLEADDNSIRYAGANPNNFVCFGSTAENCPDDNLYRIIGVFDDKVKLIKYDYALSNLLGEDGNFVSNETGIRDYPDYIANYKGSSNSVSYYKFFDGTLSTGTNYIWEDTELATINLNTNYLNNIGTDWASKIEVSNWLVGDLPTTGLIYRSKNDPIGANAKVAYDIEIKNRATGTIPYSCMPPMSGGKFENNCGTIESPYKAKVGLMYLSEYYYSASPNYWNRPGVTRIVNKDENGNYGPEYDYRTSTADNWMDMGLEEFTISIAVSNYVGIYNGEIKQDNVQRLVRPTFSLTSSTKYVSGNGEKTNPYRIA